MRAIADAIALVLKTAKPYTIQMKKSATYSARVDFEALLEGVRRANALVAKAGRDVDLPHDGYPHVWYAVNGAGRKAGDPARIAVSGQKAAAFLSVVLGTDVAALADGAEVNVLGCNRQALCAAKVTKGADGFALDVPADRATHVTQWLRALSDGYVIFDDANVGTDIPGPVAIE
jgi:hypothetical protein